MAVQKFDSVQNWCTWILLWPRPFKEIFSRSYCYTM